MASKAFRAALPFRSRLTGLQWGYSGVNSFAHLNHVKCLTKPETLFDIAILGVPFDTATTYRPGRPIYFPHILARDYIPLHRVT